MKTNILLLWQSCIILICAFAWGTASAAPTTYTYGLSANFTNGILVPEFESEIVKANIYNATLIGVTLTGDVVDIQFQNPLSNGKIRALNFLIGRHTATSLLNKFCEDLPDASITLTNAMVKLGVIVTTCTVARTYTLMTATEMVDAQAYTGKFFLVNNGSANATIAMGTGGSTPSDMIVVPGVPGQFMYTVTNDITGSHAYIVLRVS